MMQTYPPRTEKEAEAVTLVWWDIYRCPVPDDVNPCLIGPFIKESLKKLGYCGPLTITAIGMLTEVDNEVLKALCSTGVSLYHVPTEGLVGNLSLLLDNYPAPANLMGISREGLLDGYLGSLSSRQYNILESLYPERPKSICSGFTRTEGCYLWETFLADIRSATPGFTRCEVPSLSLRATSLANIWSPTPGYLPLVREPPFPGTEEWRTMAAAALYCGSCYYIDLQGFQSFANHLDSKQHALKDLYYQPFGGAVAADDSKGMDADAIRAVLKRIREAPRKLSSNEYLIEDEDEDEDED
ncbi:unnamed protein product [Microthlaspi erraticum]|uniref:NYN domain-containing protein n=1 Tax=Microthlaspi erraticum TaxID=1685480 RepID=A0A6D2IEG9_9BRAS|nr:unnamed protein product [Microthlaspi erraticum]